MKNVVYLFGPGDSQFDAADFKCFNNLYAATWHAAEEAYKLDHWDTRDQKIPEDKIKRYRAKYFNPAFFTSPYASHSYGGLTLMAVPVYIKNDGER